MKRTRVASRAGLAVVLIAIACTESIGPERRNPGVPMFSYSANGITLNKQNGALGGSGQLLIKGFNPTNPHHGDAIIATFFWLGSTNIIDSVRDVLTTAPSYTPVGNRYTLVEYVTAGGYSMATYIATNVQGFPDPNTDPNQGDILAVGAYLSQSVPDGGVVLSSWTGVEDNFATALGNHRSASGSGAAGTAMPAQAGPIAINAGALAYTVTMSGLYMLGAPAGYTSLGQGSDNSMKEGGAYAVQTSAGTTDPVWQWFNGSGSTGTWLATNLALNTATAPGGNQPPTADFTSGCSALNCSFTSTSSDPDGSIASYSWNFGDGGTSTAQNPSHTYASPGGTFTVTLQVTDNQGAQSTTTSKTVTVTAANQAPTADFTFSCSALSCNFTSTSSDPDGSIAGYSWTFGDGGTSTAQNPTHNYGAAGSYPVTLQVTDNQGAQSTTTSKTVTVSAANQPPTANFTFSCSALSCNFTSTSSDPDGSIAGYSWTFGDGGTSTAQNPTHNYGAAGNYPVTLQVTDNQGAQSTTTSKTVTVSAANQSPTADFTFSCTGLTCYFTSTSSDPDGSISAYSWTFGDGATSMAQNPVRNYAAGGTYTVTLQVTDNQGAQSTTTSKTVTVTAPNQPPTANFTSSCSGLTCNFTSTSSDPDGSIASYSWTFGDGATSTAQNPSRTYGAGGTYTVTLRVTDNQGAQSPTTSKTVTVTAPNQPPTANFTSSCSGLTCNFTSTSSDPDGSIASYSWTFGDGATSTAQNPSRTYAAGGSYSVRLTVTDNRGATNFITKTVTVTAPNSAPVVNAGPDDNAFTGLLYSFTWSFSDANHNGPWSYTIDWGDGATSSGTVSSEGSFSAGHTYIIILPRSFTIRVTVRDAAGASASDTKVVSVLLL